MTEDDKPPRGRAAWALAVAVAVLVAVAVPYGLMPAAPGLALALFWAGFGLVTILLVALAVARWRPGA